MHFVSLIFVAVESGCFGEVHLHSTPNHVISNLLLPILELNYVINDDIP